jgi:hypothetical protein
MIRKRPNETDKLQYAWKYCPSTPASLGIAHFDLQVKCAVRQRNNRRHRPGPTNSLDPQSQPGGRISPRKKYGLLQPRYDHCHIEPHPESAR